MQHFSAQFYYIKSKNFSSGIRSFDSHAKGKQHFSKTTSQIFHAMAAAEQKKKDPYEKVAPNRKLFLISLCSKEAKIV